jgi:hypothetical protein
MFSSNTSAVSGDANYIEDVFSTWLYNGTNASQTITNGIDLAGKGGLVWMKSRTSAYIHCLFDTARGNNVLLKTNSSGSQDSGYSSFFSFLSNGFSVNGSTDFNSIGDNEVSWTFRKQQKFFDCVTYTGNGSTQAISHSLGSVPGCIIIKCASSSSNWIVYHRSLGEDYFLQLNLDALRQYSTTAFDITAPTSTVFTVGSNSAVNTNGETYVAYIFAHNAGGFGLTGTDNVISCGSYTGNGSATGPTITLDYEPQWLLVKRVNGISAGAWYIIDNMRGMALTGNGNSLVPNLNYYENQYWGANFITINSKGFQVVNSDGDVNWSGSTYIYIAIRRGPMKTPTTGTSVYAPVLQNGGSFVTTNFPVDSTFVKPTAVNVATNVFDRLRSSSVSNYAVLDTATTAAELTGSGAGLGFDNNTGYEDDYFGASNRIYWNFRRAPGFFDVVCYTGNATNGRSITHNLGVVPEILIVKKRSSGAGWPTLITSEMRVMEIDIDSGYKSAASTKFFYGDGSSDIAPTSSVFTVASGGDVNGSGSTYVAYLFASCPGVSKVGSYTGTGTTQQINCGFTGGARFVLIKATSTNGEWLVWDTARGIVAGNDPYLALDSTAAQVTNTDWVDTNSAGFELSDAAGNLANTNGVSYIFLAIA